jgi:hypothetical protein
MLPYYAPEIIIGANKINLNTFFGFIRCKVTCTKEMMKGKKPLHGTKDEDGKLIFPYMTNKEIVLFSEEIKYGMTLGIKYEVLDALRFRKAPIFKKCFEDAFKEKQKASKEGNTALELCHKIIANSTYGFPGMRKNDRDGVEIGLNLCYNDYLDQGKLMGVGKCGNYDVLRVKKDIDVKDVTVSISAAISSYARMRLHQFMTKIEEKGGTIYYIDTDSVITDLNIKLHDDIVKEFQWDLKGDELGCVKNECYKPIKKKYGLDVLNKQIEMDGELFFDGAYIVGNKAYNVYKTIYNGEKIEINKLKGYKQCEFYDVNHEKIEYNLNSNDYERLINGEKIKQKQLQFSCNKQNMVGEQNSFKVRHRTIEKSFKIQYTKGENIDYEKLKNEKIINIIPKNIIN